MSEPAARERAMCYHSTSGGHGTDLVGALMQGLAPDGRLYVPERYPSFDPAAIAAETLPEIAEVLLEPFFAGSRLASELREICTDALDFPIPLRALAGREGPLAVLELFHGPTAAFKDVGARLPRGLPAAGARGIG